MSNFRQVAVGVALYSGDYDDLLVPAQYTASEEANSRTDRTWVQLLLPYTKSFTIFFCPADHSAKQLSTGTFDEDLVVGDSYARYYHASMHTNLGYNFVYLSPLVRFPNSPWFAVTRSLSEIQTPSDTLLFGDSVWSVDERGRPEGGGSFLVIPPCRYLGALDGAGASDTFHLPGVPGWRIYQGDLLWDNSWTSGDRAGGLFPWHGDRLNVAFIDGSVRSLSLKQITAGCEVAPHWSGAVISHGDYLWDLD